MATSSTRSEAVPQICVPLGEKPRLYQMGWSVHGVHTRADHFRLPDLWCLHFYKYHGRLRLDDVWLDIAPGYVGITPPDCDIEYRYKGRSEHSYAHFELARNPDGASSTRSAENSSAEDSPIENNVSLPLMQRLRDMSLGCSWEEAIGFYPTQKLRAETRLWDVLWRLAEQSDVAQAVLHPVVRRAQELIELRLSERICVADLARELDISHNHLTRLFQAHCEQSVVSFIASRRVERARHLLTHSTLPIKAIASQVGIYNLQDFNKIMRRYEGVSPRALRFGSSTRTEVNSA